ncbi:MAG: hypothetical protein HC838_08815 [Spirulinaceae cyanobacterium RM2_2_10]|nr:hypothetical protein [Spirulinaceae cyanobacterium SM2_1_0]NJO20126.1 hypothetical protein [Spirulinaceae cyanobacterium RM2_2_10]
MQQADVVQQPLNEAENRDAHARTLRQFKRRPQRSLESADWVNAENQELGNFINAHCLQAKLNFKLSLNSSTDSQATVT